MDIKTGEGVEISLGYVCNYSCIFCFQKNLQDTPSFNREYIFDLLNEWFQNGKSFVIFTWWEPTLDQNLADYILCAKQIGYDKILLHTNGFKLADPHYLRVLYANWLNGVVLSIHGYGAVADVITGIRGSFILSIKALVNISKIINHDHCFTLDSNTIICDFNGRTLHVLYLFLLKFPIIRRMFTYPYALYGFSQEELSTIYGSYSNSMDEVKKILDNACNKNTNNVVIESIPHCLIHEKYWRFIEQNFRTQKDLHTVSTELQDFYWDDQYYTSKIYVVACRNCKKKGKCFGIPSDYIKVHGENEFKAII